MKALIKQYFKDSKDVWHQPGNIDDIEPQDIEPLMRRNAIKVIETAMEEPPETRIISTKNRRRK